MSASNGFGRGGHASLARNSRSIDRPNSAPASPFSIPELTPSLTALLQSSFLPAMSSPAVLPVSPPTAASEHAVRSPSQSPVENQPVPLGDTSSPQSGERPFITPEDVDWFVFILLTFVFIFSL